MPNQFPNCHFGASGGSWGMDRFIGLEPYDLAAFNLGWYIDWDNNPHPQEPYGMEFAQTIRMRPITTTPYYRLESPRYFTALQQLVQARPNDIYFIGSEPDSPYHDNLCAPVYARAYHDVYTFIKNVSPEAQVGIGAVVQPTPLRMQYLDAIWNSYQISYGQQLPTDFFNIHSYILTEERNGWWGAYIPPCMNVDRGTIYDVTDQDNMDIFISRINDFRQWMAAKGERNKPLYITEFGILFPEDIYPFYTEPKVRAFMWNTFNYFLGPRSISSTVGYPRDSNHLVQRWMWFSLMHDPWHYGGSLFDPPVPPTRTVPMILPLGLDWITGTHGVSPWITDTQGLTLSLNLMPYNPSVTMLPEPLPVTATVQVEIVNSGNFTVTRSFHATLYDENWAPVMTQTIQPVAGCGRFNLTTFIWPNLQQGLHTGHIRVDPDNWIMETNESDNDIEVTVPVALPGQYLPITTKPAGDKSSSP